jgi:hypothetical protein
MGQRQLQIVERFDSILSFAVLIASGTLAGARPARPSQKKARGTTWM